MHALDWLNFVAADVRDGVGPFLAIYLMVGRHWEPAAIGLAMSAMGIAAIAAQTPAGALVDRLRSKRALIVVASLAVAAGCLSIVHASTFAGVITAQMLIGGAGTIFPAATAALTLGLVGPQALSQRLGRNESFNHAGNVAAAVLAGLTGYYVAYEAIFYQVMTMAMATIGVVAMVRARDIDHAGARGARQASGGVRIVSARELLADPRIAVFVLAAVLFHFANAAMLPLVGQMLSAGKGSDASLFMAACIVAAQVVMVPVASLSGRLAARLGRKPVLLSGFLILPVRGVLYTVSDDPYFLVSVQLLDGIGAGMFGVLSVLVVADLTRGTGRFNLTNGAISTATGIGAAASNAMSGVIVQQAGYHAAFLTLAAIAGVAALWLALMMPETRAR